MILKKYNIFHYNDTGMVPNHPNHQLHLEEKLVKRNGYSVSKQNSSPPHRQNGHHNGHGSSSAQGQGTLVHSYEQNSPGSSDSQRYVNSAMMGSPPMQGTGTAVARKPFFITGHAPPPATHLPPPPIVSYPTQLPPENLRKDD